MKRQTLFSLFLIFSCSLFAQTGGPDAFGYSYITSDAVDGPEFEWIELDVALGGTGTLSTASDIDDGYQGGISLGFEFPFYGSMYNTVSIASNGTVYFANLNLSWDCICLPGDPAYGFPDDTAFIALIWGDLAPNGGGDIYYKDFGSYFVVEYSNVVESGETDGDTWEVILYETGAVKMQFKETSFTAVSGAFTTGIQGSPTEGLNYKCFGAGDAISDSLAILYTGPLSDISEMRTTELSIYPNPNNGHFNFILRPAVLESSFSFEIKDLQGKLIYFEELTKQFETIIEVSDLSPGIYFVTVKSSGSTYTDRIIVN